jgi:hypothetical protein
MLKDVGVLILYVDCILLSAFFGRLLIDSSLCWNHSFTLMLFIKNIAVIVLHFVQFASLFTGIGVAFSFLRMMSQTRFFP